MNVASVMQRPRVAAGIIALLAHMLSFAVATQWYLDAVRSIVFIGLLLVCAVQFRQELRGMLTHRICIVFFGTMAFLFACSLALGKSRNPYELFEWVFVFVSGFLLYRLNSTHALRAVWCIPLYLAAAAIVAAILLHVDVLHYYDVFAPDDRLVLLTTNPNRLGMIAGVAVCIGVYGVLTGHGPARWLHGMALPVNLALCGMSQSRTALIALVVSAVLLCVRRYCTGRVRVSGKTIVISLMVAATLVAGMVGYRMADTPVASVSYALDGRDFIWNIAANIVREHPILGTGYGSFKYVYGAYYRRFAKGELPDYFALLEPHRGIADTNHAHNLYLGLAADTGLAGVALLALITGMCLFHARHLAERGMLLYPLLFYAVYSLAEFGLYRSGDAGFLFLVFGVCAAVTSPKS